MAKPTMICAGIDTGKYKLDVAIEGSAEQLQVDNTPEGYKVLSDWLRRHRVKRVGIEASGAYEQAVVVELRRKRFVVVMFQPAQVRAYARFKGQRAKNDRIDAALIAACTAAVKTVHAAPDPRLLPFARRLTMIDQVGEDIARLKNRLESCRDARIQQIWKEDLARLEKRKSAELKAPGGGNPRPSRPRRAARSDLQRERRGVTDRGRDSGAHARDRKAQSRAGCRIGRTCSLSRRQRRAGGHPSHRGRRERLRRALYAAALPASMRWNPQLIALYKRLIAAGKQHKRALVACARKLLIFVNTVVARGTPCQSEARPAAITATA